MILLSREQFKKSVLTRDHHKCVFCDLPAVDAHHILERRLFADGGYYLDNGASVCAVHHLECELTIITVEQVREACGITNVVVPDTMYGTDICDKWGNPVLFDGTRSKGPLFYDDAVQKVLIKAGFLSLFSHHVKAARTMHFSWSPGVQSDDKVIINLNAFHDQEVVLSIKKDGENTSIYSDYFHARSIDGRNHESRSWVKSKWSQIRYDIPDKWRITGENVFAVHSIEYTNLESYFYGFGVWNEYNVRLDWDDMLEWFSLLDITSVETLYRGPFDEKTIRDICEQIDFTTEEGAVLTTVKGFQYNKFHLNVAKYVRADHVQSDKNWMQQSVVPNKLKVNK